MTTQLIEYIKSHKLYVSQELEKVWNSGYSTEYLQGSIAVMDHLLSVVDSINTNSIVAWDLRESEKHGCTCHNAS